MARTGAGANEEQERGQHRQVEASGEITSLDDLRFGGLGNPTELWGLSSGRGMRCPHGCRSEQCCTEDAQEGYAPGKDEGWRE